MNFVIFIFVGLSILLLLHYYLWLRLVRRTQLAAPWRAITTIGLVLAGTSIPVALFLLRRSADSPFRPLLWAPLIWMGWMFLLFVLLLGTDAICVGSGYSDARPAAKHWICNEDASWPAS